MQAAAGHPTLHVVSSQAELNRVQSTCLSEVLAASSQGFPSPDRTPCTVLLLPSSTTYLFLTAAPLLAYYTAVIGLGSTPEATKIRFESPNLALDAGINSADNGAPAPFLALQHTCTYM